jgi:hypothetical protein
VCPLEFSVLVVNTAGVSEDSRLVEELRGLLAQRDTQISELTAAVAR